jgi:hypothetical protein
MSGGFYTKNITNRLENPKNMNAVAWVVSAKCHAPAREYTRTATIFSVQQPIAER